VKLVLAFSESLGGIVAAGAVYGLAYGVAQPALIAWSVDVVPEGERGRAIGTYHAAFELGIVAGAAASGLAVGPVGLRGDLRGHRRRGRRWRRARGRS